MLVRQGQISCGVAVLQRDAASWWLASVRRVSASTPPHQDATTSSTFYDSTVERYAAQPTEILSLFQMLQFGRQAAHDPERILKSGRFVQREIPKRLARRLLDLQLLPYIVVTNPHIKRVYDNYYTSFNALRALPPMRTLQDNAAFTAILQKQLDQHAPMLDALAAGLREVKGKQLVGRCLQLDAFFDSMLRSRISRRVIAEQHLQLTERRPGYVGIIATDLEVADAVDFAAQKARQVCAETFGAAPDILVGGDVTARVAYIPAHLDYMLYELLKNSARAVVEHVYARQGWQASLSADSVGGWGGVGALGDGPARGLLPPIHVRICAGHQSPDLTIKISDQGGGIPPSMQDKVWSYGFTTLGGIPAGYDVPSVSAAAPDGPGTALPGGGGGPPAQVLQGGALPSGYAAAGSHQSHWTAYSPSPAASGPYAPLPLSAPAAAAPLLAGLGADTMIGVMRGEGGVGAGLDGGGRSRMAGLGFGLPMSRLYARFFGGDLTLQVVPGYGTDAYLTIKRLEDTQWREPHDEPGLQGAGLLNHHE